MEQSERAIIVIAELNFCSWRHSSLALLVSCITHRVKQELIKVVWTPKKGVNQDSFSYLTRGWNKKPWSVLDTKGRQVLLMNQRPKDHNVKVSYNPLQLNGCVLLDSDDDPVRDVPGLPLTLSTEIEGWFIAGLRRSLKMEMKE